MANAIRNTIMLGGVNGSPGVLPDATQTGTSSNWSIFGGTGLTRTLHYGNGPNGFPCMDLTVSGINSDGFLQIIFGVCAASQSLPWTPSVYLQLISGNLTNVTQFEIDYDTSSGTFGSSAFITFDRLQHIVTNPTATSARVFGTATSDVGTTLITPYIFIPMSSTLAVSFGLRLEGPQLEQGSSPTPFQSTPNPNISAQLDPEVFKMFVF